MLVGEDPASQVYVRNKVAGCAKVGMHSVMHKMPVSTTEAELLAVIDALNKDASIHGILVQLPLPKHIAEKKVLEAVAAHKDVDGFHVENVGALMIGEPRSVSCTPAGCMEMLSKTLAPKTCVVNTPSSSAAATSSANRWRCSFCMPTRRSRFAIPARPILPRNAAKPTSSWQPSASLAHQSRNGQTPAQS